MPYCKSIVNMFTKLVIAIVVVGTLGCGGPAMTMHPLLRMHDGCQLQEVWYESPLYDPFVVLNFEFARDMLDNAGIITKDAFCPWMGDMHVEIIHADNFPEIGGLYEGYYDVFKGITIGGNMSALVHEILHSVDMARLDLATPFHEGWHDLRHFPGSTVTFYGLDANFSKEAVNPVCCGVDTQPTSP